MSDEHDEPKRTWEATPDVLRPRLIRVAYRMLSSVTDAEDVVQEAFLRSLHVRHDDIRDAEAWLRRVVTRLSLNHLQTARRRRETYIGPWLPEPVIESMENSFDDVTLPLLLALERLSPLERAAFLLHDVFGMSFDEVAQTLDRAPAACRQLASRARAHVRVARPRFPVPKERGLKIAEAFFAASRSGDMQTLRSLLALPTAAARQAPRSNPLSGSTRSRGSMRSLPLSSRRCHRESSATA